MFQQNIIFAATIIKWFVFKYFIHFTTLGLRFQNRLFFYSKKILRPLGQKSSKFQCALIIFFFKQKAPLLSFDQMKTKKTGIAKAFKSNLFVYLRIALSVSIKK